MELFGLNIHFPVTDPTWIFFLVLIIILFAPMILGRLRIPHIIGMILAGVLVGKYGFNILERDSSFELFGKVGLYYIMFLAGLEMDMDDFKKEQNKGIGLWTVHFPDTDGAWYMEQYEFIGLRTCHFHPVGQYVCQSYFDSLSHYQSLRFVPAAYGEHNDWGNGGDCRIGLDGACRDWRYV